MSENLDHSDTDDANGDGEGVWSPDIEQCFREALLLFPPCGRRKHTLREEGGRKMYGRNELIARHIMMRTGKVRTRKQVSSHIQVLARRRAKAEAGGSNMNDGAPSVGSASPANSVGAPINVNAMLNTTSNNNNNSNTNNSNNYSQRIAAGEPTANQQHLQQLSSTYNVWVDRPIVTQKIRLVEFSAFVELAPTTGSTRHPYIKIDYSLPNTRKTNKLERIDVSQIQDKFPDLNVSEGLYARGPADAFFLVKFWVDLNDEHDYSIEDQNSYFGFSSHFETIELYKDIKCSTKACSYGLQVVEKVVTMYGTYNSFNGRYSYVIDRSPMCEFMIQFIKKLRQLPGPAQMNSVLENFTVLQTIRNESTSEILLCLAYVFEIASPGLNQGPRYHVYKLTRN